jgi:tetratricopeptide (TPR) repeat protein
VSCVVDFKYKAFISYSHRDEKVTSWLHKKLEGYKPPKHLVGQETPAGKVPARLSPVFRDREELHTATNLGAILKQALADSAAQIVVCSPAAASSHWVNEEILAFKRLGREDRILCLIIGGEPYASGMPGREAEECFPKALRYELGPDGELSDVPTEPIAADIRPGKDGKSNATLKLIAGLLEVSFDSLRQRELHRRQRRLVAIASAATVGMVIAIGLATVAFIARAEADRQRVRAEIEAETARQTTSFMIDLFKVSDPSEARGNTITAREILDKGAQKVEAELSDQPAIQAALMDTMGSVYKGLGLYPEARNLANAALSSRRSIHGDMHTEVAASQTNLADIMSYQADYVEALSLLSQALAAQRTLLGEAHPEVAETLVLTANILSIQAEYERAEGMLREALLIQRASIGTENLVVAKTLEDLGMVMFDQAEYSAAEELLVESLSMRRKLLQAEAHPQLAEGEQNLAVLMHTTGRYDEAEQLFLDVLEMRRHLLGDNHPEITLVMNNIAFVRHDKGDLEAAEIMYREVIANQQRLLGRDHPETVRSVNNLAFLLYDMGRVSEAMDMIREVVELNKRIYGTNHPEVAFTSTTLGVWLAEDGDVEQAEPILIEAVDIARNVYDSDHPDLGKSVAALAFLYLEADRPEEAGLLAAEASEIFVDAFSEDYWRTAWANTIQGAALARQERYAEAENLLISAYVKLESGENIRPFYMRKSSQYVAEMYAGWGKAAEAARYNAKEKQYLTL